MGWLSKIQKLALQELGRGDTNFGPHFRYTYRTGMALVEKGLAEVISSSKYKSSGYSEYRLHIKATITQKGKDAVDCGGRFED